VLRATWQLSAGIATACAVVFLLARLRPGSPCSLRTCTHSDRWHRIRALVAGFGAEFAMVAGVFAVYQHTAHFAHTRIAGAVDHARVVQAIQDWLPLPSEAGVQGLILPHRLAVDAANAYYAGMHLTSMTAFLVWMWWRHRDRYALARNTVALTTLVCVTLQMVPVAPPRLMPGGQFVDTGLEFGMSVYGPQGQGIAAQLAAMPSLHVAWAGIIAGFGVSVSRSPWRWLLAAHFALTMFVVVATANHWWLDGIAGLTVAGLAVTTLATIRNPIRTSVGTPTAKDIGVRK
jgi:PAP2 superfamily